MNIPSPISRRVLRQKLALLGTLLLAVACSAQAQFTSWTTPGSGNWFTAANWDNGLPVAGWIVTIGEGVPGSAQVSFGDGYAKRLILGNTADGTLTIDNGGKVVLTDGLLVAKSSAGTVNLNSTGTLQVAGVNGLSKGSGVATFNFAGGTLKVRDDDLTGDVPMILSGTTSTIDVFGNFTATLSGSLSGNGDLTKRGTGTLVLPVANTLGGSTKISEGTLSVSGTNASLVTPFISIGETNPGALRVEGGALVTTSGDVVANVGAISIAGANSRFAVSGNMTVGTVGATTMTVAPAATVSIAGHVNLATTNSSTASVNLQGTLEVGGANGFQKGAGTATLNLNGGLLKVVGSDLTSNVPIEITSGTIDTNGFNASLSGVISGSNYPNLTKVGTGVLTLAGTNTFSNSSTFVDGGTLAISGATARLDGKQLLIGYSSNSNAVFSVTNGGTVSVSDTSLAPRVGNGAGSNGTLNIDGPGSTMSISSGNAFMIGADGSGVVNISNGGVLTTNITAVGNNGSPGIVNVTGAGSKILAYNLTVGNTGGAGTINIADGGVVQAAFVTIGNGGPASFNVNAGGRLNVISGFLAGSTSPLNLAGGTLYCSAGLQSIPVVLADGTNSTIAAGTLVGTISGGGALTITGNVTFGGAKTYTGATTVANGGTLYVTKSVTSNITVQQGGSLTRDGNVGAITLENGAKMLLSAGVSNTMQATSLTWDGGAQIAFSLNTSGYLLTIDLNGALLKGTGSGFVFSFTTSGFQNGRTYDLINFNGTTFDASDFSFTTTSGPAIGGYFSFDEAGDTLRFTATAVPEPSVWALLLMGVPILVFCAHRRGRSTKGCCPDFPKP